METESSAELMAPSTAVKGAAPAKEQPLSSGPKTGPGKAGGFKKILSKCERMALADQARRSPAFPSSRAAAAIAVLPLARVAAPASEDRAASFA
eukprot:scaffold17254_cov99-Isochrysis_galbana.AAC.6